MVSATDVITYIGVPLAVLGVLPIFYTLASSLYTRIKVQHALRRNGIDAHVRARLMTGAVEVDLPRYELKPLSRKCEQYWSNPEQKTLTDTSWSCFHWSQREIGRCSSRLQRSDTIRLPEAKIRFDVLIMFLQDRGASTCLEGFRTLREHRQQTPTLTTLMEYVSRNVETLPSTASYSSYPILAFARPGTMHGSISLRFHSPLDRKHHSDLTSCWRLNIPETCPSSWIIVPSGAELDRKYFMMIGTCGVEYVGLQSGSTPDTGDRVELAHHHLFRKSPLDDVLENAWLSSAWLSSAVVAIFGYHNQRYFRFQTNERLVDLAQWYDVHLRYATYLGILHHPHILPDKVVHWLTDGSNNMIQPRHSRETFELTRKTWARYWKLNRGDTARPAFDEIQFWDNREDLGDIEKGGKIPDKYMSMSTLLICCLSFLINHSKTNEFFKMPEIPVIKPTPWPAEDFRSFDRYIQETAETIIRAILLDGMFAERVRGEMQTYFSIFTGQYAQDWDYSPTHRPENHSETVSQPWLNTSITYCCGIVLLAVIAQRGEYLLSGEVVNRCEKEWEHVYLT